MEVEAVTHAIRRIASTGDNQTTHAIILKDSMSLLQQQQQKKQKKNKIKKGIGLVLLYVHRGELAY